MNIAQKLQDKWNATPADFAQRLGISTKTATSWLEGRGTPKDVGKKLLHLAASDRKFDASKLTAKEREKYTASEWVKYLMQRFGDYRVSQFARRLGLNYTTVSAWHHSQEKYLKGTAEALLLYAYHHPDKFPTK